MNHLAYVKRSLCLLSLSLVLPLSASPTHAEKEKPAQETINDDEIPF